MTDTVGVASEPLRGGVVFQGPRGKVAWSPDGYLSSALGFVVGWDVAAHPWDPWPKRRETARCEIFGQARSAQREAQELAAAPRRQTVRALSLTQPWAWLLIHGGKDVENRVWTTQLRGEFLIHASKGMRAADFEAAWQMARRIDQSLAWKLLEARNGRLADAVISRGGIVGVAEIFDVLAPTDTPTVPWHMAGQYGFRLRNVRPLPFLPCSGMQRWWGNFEIHDGKAVQL